MYNASDVYVSGGPNTLLSCWTDKVTLHDASSFYNWEQDNLPLLDLEERTRFLWEQFGQPTSAITGVSWIVSADATSSCNPRYFKSLSACITNLPEVINYPILIEVASFGNLGKLDLSNKAFGPRGSLEIINRNSGFMGGYSLSGGAYASNSVHPDSVYGLASAVFPEGHPLECLRGAWDGLSTWSNGTIGAPVLPVDIFRKKLLTTDLNGSAIYISSGAIFDGSGFEDVRYVNPYVFTRRVDNENPSRLTAALQSTAIPWVWGDDGGAYGTPTNLPEWFGVGVLRFNPYDLDAGSTERATYDVSTLNFIDGSEIQWGSTTSQPAGNPGSTSYNNSTFAYFNSLESLRVTNCDGPIYIRNFNVDANHLIDNGIEILNSNINLERCSVSRSNSAGLYAKNSDINLLKGFVAYRNYKLDGIVRTGVPFSEKRISYKTMSNYGAGIRAVDSTINFKSTYARDIQYSLLASGSDMYTNHGVTYGRSLLLLQKRYRY
jgi:hypothetical protein